MIPVEEKCGNGNVELTWYLLHVPTIYVLSKMYVFCTTYKCVYMCVYVYMTKESMSCKWLNTFSQGN